MREVDLAAFEAAERFVWLSGRLLERLRFARLFRGGEGARVVQALRPYQNADGGFGEAIEPDFRGPVSQPLCVEAALRVLDEVGSLQDPMVEAALGYLGGLVAADGGIPNVLSDVPRYPHAPWWAPAEGVLPGCLLPTASLVGLLHKHGVTAPWVARATAFCWEAIEAMPGRVAAAAAAKERVPLLQIAYESRAALVFLDHAPERARAAQAAQRLGEVLLEPGGIVALEAQAGGHAGEVMMPLEFAPHPGCLARRWFDERLIEAHLDALVGEQAEDGGWTVGWAAWTPAAGLEWRAIQTLERLKVLAAHGRLKVPAAIR
ncbi:hypothetical protein [Chondromyces apiculatus]|uniref:Uncharacterized protein n=1 Tax=Chondromyces apiculatus DSM 436 TaxID=1192034 RepID=A0A017SWN8_9BACT|nr:hypothetical protein [Chondromyces apiculatus]EYF01388.1 Hypothetical protein CAP_8319 [Chondromyces apiculatus DSM 436]